MSLMEFFGIILIIMIKQVLVPVLKFNPNTKTTEHLHLDDENF